MRVPIAPVPIPRDDTAYVSSTCVTEGVQSELDVALCEAREELDYAMHVTSASRNAGLRGTGELDGRGIGTIGAIGGIGATLRAFDELTASDWLGDRDRSDRSDKDRSDRSDRDRSDRSDREGDGGEGASPSEASEVGPECDATDDRVPALSPLLAEGGAEGGAEGRRPVRRGGRRSLERGARIRGARCDVSPGPALIRSMSKARYRALLKELDSSPTSGRAPLPPPACDRPKSAGTPTSGGGRFVAPSRPSSASACVTPLGLSYEGWGARPVVGERKGMPVPPTPLPVSISTPTLGRAPFFSKSKISALRRERDVRMSSSALGNLPCPCPCPTSAIPSVQSQNRELARAVHAKMQGGEVGRLLVTPGFFETLGPDKIYRSAWQMDQADTQELQRATAAADVSNGLRCDPLRVWADNAVRNNLKIFVARTTTFKF